MLLLLVVVIIIEFEQRSGNIAYPESLAVAAVAAAVVEKGDGEGSSRRKGPPLEREQLLLFSCVYVHVTL